jgi:hypothetical protein
MTLPRCTFTVISLTRGLGRNILLRGSKEAAQNIRRRRRRSPAIGISFKKTISDGGDPGASSYEIRYRARVIDNLHRRAKAFGFVLQPTAPVAGIGVQLLAALRAMFAKNRTEITSEQVVQELLADPDSQWHEYRGRGPITKHQVAALLKDFEIRPVVVHPTKRAAVSRHGYRAAQFDDAFARFLPPEPNIRTLKRGGGGKT